MKILMITGSPRRKGTSNTLAARFEEGALAAGPHRGTVRRSPGQSRWLQSLLLLPQARR